MPLIPPPTARESTPDGFRFVNGRPLPSSLSPSRLDSPMLIVCPNCATSYRVEPSSLGASGTLGALRALSHDLVRPRARRALPPWQASRSRPDPRTYPGPQRRADRNHRSICNPDRRRPEAEIETAPRRRGEASERIPSRRRSRQSDASAELARSGRTLVRRTTVDRAARRLRSDADARRGASSRRGAPAEDIETLAARRARQRPRRRALMARRPACRSPCWRWSRSTPR